MAKETIGAYKVLKEIGKGGMGRVYMALQPSLNRTVVIKEMSRGLSSDAQARFKREAILCANLHHQNIVEIYDYFKEGGANYLVMEYVEGIDLDEVIKRASPMHPDTAAAIAHEICQALACAHHNNIIHRDIKPKNVLISKDGAVKLTDFGVARDVDAPDLTTPGMIIGTPFYMSPEQASGAKVSFQSDVYSMGIVLYEMLTAKKPFTGDKSQGIIAKICRGNYRSPFWLDPHHSARLSHIINRAMKRSARRRYKTAEEMLKDLKHYLGWKHQASVEADLQKLISDIDQERESTTIIKSVKKIKKKTDIALYFLIFLILALIVILIFKFLI
jgi:serine/threonine protein kinase